MESPADAIDAVTKLVGKALPVDLLEDLVDLVYDIWTEAHAEATFWAAKEADSLS
jgi:hypothetical protein